MRRHPNTQAQAPGARRRSSGLALLILAAGTTLALAFLATTTAYAGLYHSKPPVASFGPLGGACVEGDLATGTGDLTSGSKEITSVVTTCGAFEVGQEVSGTGLSGTITAVGAGTLTVSSAASASGSGVALATSSKFAGVRLLAFGQAAHRLYAVESSLKELFGFDLSTPGAYTPLAAPFPFSIPTYPSFSGTSLAVDDSGGPTQGNVYTATPNGEKLILGYNASGAPLPGFPIVSPPEPLEKNSNGWKALAVDPNGDLWGANFKNGENVAYEYSPAGVLLNTVSLPGDQVQSLAFAANGDLYADTLGTTDSVWKLSAPAYAHPQIFVEGIIGYLDLDRASGDLYIASPDTIFAGSSNRVLRYRSDGTLLEEFAAGLGAIEGVALDEANGAAYVSADQSGHIASKVYVFDAQVLPDLAIAAPSGPSETLITLHGTVEPGGVALTGCKFEWVTETAYQATGFTSLASGGEKACSPASGSISTTGTTSVSASLTGLSPGKTYRYRLLASNVNGTNTDKGVPASIALTRPGVETVGAPIRTATTARLDARIDPHGIATEYHFEYISDAAYQANVAASESPFTGAATTAFHSVGFGGLIELASQTIENLAPATTYHYRVVADSHAFGGPAIGEARTLETRASDAPLSHGSYPGPPGSDRAWEQVNLPDTGGNPVSAAAGISADGGAVLYQVTGGTPLSESGTLFNFLFARRPAGEHPASGWKTEQVYPARADTAFNAWRPPTGDDGLSSLIALNTNFEEGSGAAVWRIPTTGGAPAKLYESPRGQYEDLYVVSDDGSRALLVLKGSAVDSEHKSPGGVDQLYDVGSGEPHMVSLLPGNTVPSCGVSTGGTYGPFQFPVNWVSRTTHWVSADGSYAFFPSAGNASGCATTHLYMRDFAASATYRVDGPPLEGPDCSGAMIRSTPNAVYFWTQSKLAPEDTKIAGGCGGEEGGDVYRYDLTSHALKCLTCVVPEGRPANVLVSGPEGTGIAVAPDGSRVYFTTKTRLLPSTAETGTPAVYRVDVTGGSIAYVAPLNPGERVGENPTGGFAQAGSTVSADGRFLVFGSSSPGLDALTGSDNGHTVQYYIYDDVERSLLCASCPPDGGAPRDAAASAGVIVGVEPGPNITPLADNGDFAFATPTPLVAADQNTAPVGRNPLAGTDVYEWRDGRPLLVSDGLTSWPRSEVPQVAGVSPDGKNLFFTEAAQLTPDALDGYTRLYDARIGGGIDFPSTPKPCPLEVCQGASKEAPEEAQPGSVFFSGSGNLTPPSVTTTAPAKPRAKPLTRAQLLAKALRACKRGPKRKRSGCEARARKQYGSRKAAKAVTINNRGAAR